MRIVPFFLALLLLASCNQPGNPMQVRTPAPVLASDTLRVTKMLKGIYRNNGTPAFIDCENPKMTYRVKDDAFQLDSALKKILPAAYSGQAIYVEMNAEISSLDSKVYSGLLDLKSLIKTEQKNENNTCIPYDFFGKGTEPFWQLQISKEENLIDFYKPMEQKTWHFLYAAPEMMDGKIMYHSTEVGHPKNKIQVAIYKEKCSDGMSDKQYDYRVDVIMDIRYGGCGVKGK